MRMRTGLLVAVLFVGILTGFPADVRAQTAAGERIATEQAEAKRDVLGSDVVSLRRIRELVGARGASLDMRRSSPAGRSVATYRVETFGAPPYGSIEALKQSLAVRETPAQPGFFDTYSGPLRPGALHAGDNAVSVNSLLIVDSVRRWARRRAVSKAREEVEAELRALLAARKNMTEGQGKQP